MIRLAVVALSPAYRAGLRVLLEGEDIHVTTELSTLIALPDFIHKIDVLVVDIPVPSILDEIRTTSEVLPLLLLVPQDMPDMRSLFLLLNGAWGVLPRDAGAEDLRAAVHALYAGLQVARPGLLRNSFSHKQTVNLSDDVTTLEPLTPREAEVLQLLSQGLANKQIAAALRISEHTVKFHISSIFAKWGAGSRTEAVRIGLQHGLITL